MLSNVKSSSPTVICISVLISVFLVGVFALVSSARESAPGLQESAPQSSYTAFTLTTSRSLGSEDRRERLLSTQQRFQRSDGLYKLVQTFYAADGTKAGTQTYFGFLGLGVFRLDEAGRRLIFTGPLIDDRQADVGKFLREHELFAREESVAGISTIVWRQCRPMSTSQSRLRCSLPPRSLKSVPTQMSLIRSCSSRSHCRMASRINSSTTSTARSLRSLIRPEGTNDLFTALSCRSAIRRCLTLKPIAA
jgi:hypothetical protein